MNWKGSNCITLLTEPCASTRDSSNMGSFLTVCKMNFTKPLSAEGNSLQNHPNDGIWLALCAVSRPETRK